MKYIVFLATTILVFFSLISCGNSENIPDISNIEVDYNIIRVEDKLMNIDTNNIEKSIKDFYSEYPDFAPIFFENILPYYKKESSIEENTINFVRDSSILYLYNIVHNKYGNFSKIENELDKALAYYKYYFPIGEVPDIYTYISGFGYQRFIFSLGDKKDGIGLGLDMFLDKEIDYKAYFPKDPQFSDYNVRTFDENHIVQKTLDVIISDKLGTYNGNKMIEEMVYYGKNIYIINKLLPYTNDSIIMNYSREQLEWCDNNEYEMWTFFKNQKLLFESNPKKIAKYINPAPFSPGMEEIAPGRTGIYIGWKIVEAYMEEYPDLGLDDLIRVPLIEVYKNSKYKPRRKK